MEAFFTDKGEQLYEGLNFGAKSTAQNADLAYEGMYGNISFDSHIVLILENEIVLIFELESDMTDFIDLIITDIKNSDNVIKDYGNKNGDYSVNISQRILLENKE